MDTRRQPKMKSQTLSHKRHSFASALSASAFPSLKSAFIEVYHAASSNQVAKPADLLSGPSCDLLNTALCETLSQCLNLMTLTLTKVFDSFLFWLSFQQLLNMSASRTAQIYSILLSPLTPPYRSVTGISLDDSATILSRKLYPHSPKTPSGPQPKGVFYQFEIPFYASNVIAYPAGEEVEDMMCPKVNLKAGEWIPDPELLIKLQEAGRRKCGENKDYWVKVSEGQH